MYTPAPQSPPITDQSAPHPTRNRIKSHRKIRAGDLVPHEWNFRLHPDAQKAALLAIYQEIGFARSLLAYELPDGRLKLIDGHLRRDLDPNLEVDVRDLDPNLEVDVEVLDVNDAEARALLLSIDPLAALAETQDQLHQRLLDMTPTISPDLTAAWQATARAALDSKPEPIKWGPETIEAQFHVLIICRDEKEQVELLRRFQREGLKCKALLA